MREKIYKLSLTTAGFWKKIPCFTSSLSLDIKNSGKPKEQKHLIKKSTLMDKLYGPEVSQRVFDRIQALDPLLNKEIQEIAYDHYWARPGLTIRDKSLVTVASLIALGKEEQTRIHMNGFLNAGGSNQELLNILTHTTAISAEAGKKGFAAFVDVLKERNVDPKIIHEIQTTFADNVRSNISTIHNRDRHIVDLSYTVALGVQPKTEEYIKFFLQQPEVSKDDLKNIMIHQIVYCGFPATMNGFAALKSVLDKELQDSPAPKARL